MAPMKGLTQFIADLRNARAQEEEDRRINTELVNIRKSFVDPGLSGYNRKKYICKLMYIHVLGHNVTFGHMEAIQLMQSKVFSEKAMGYFAVSLLLQPGHEMMPLTINSLKSDIENNNYDVNCLALHLVATIADSEYASLLAEPVFSLVRSPTTPPVVKKKAVLAALRMVKVTPNLWHQHHKAWLPRVIALIDQDQTHLGLSLAAVSLIAHVGKESPDSIAACIPIVVQRLHDLIVDGKCPAAYVYNGIADPWLTVKLFALMQQLASTAAFAQIDVSILSSLRSTVAKAIENGRKRAETQALNAQSAVLFSAVSLATRLDPSPEAIEGAIDALSQLIVSKDTNTRYLALESLVKVVGGAPSSFEVKNSLKKHTDQVLDSLKDKDVSVRQKSLRVLLLVCDFQNIAEIMSHLLDYLEAADYISKPKISTSLYTLTEKYAGDLSWYVTTTLKILHVSGIYSSPEIWQGFITVIVNSNSAKLKDFACKSLMMYLVMPNCNEILLRTGGFLLGEYCVLVSQTPEPQLSGANQYALLNDKYFASGLQTRYVLLTAFLKYYKHFPEIRKPISMFFRQELNSINTEIQQRSVEYIKLVSRQDTMELLDSVIQEIPEFPNAYKSTILARLEKNGVAVLDPAEERNLLDIDAQASPVKDIFSPIMETPAVFNPFGGASEDEDDSSVLEESQVPKVLSSHWDVGYYRVLKSKHNVFYENSLIQIILRIDTTAVKASKKVHLLFTFKNKSPAPISSLLTKVHMVKSVNPPIVVRSLLSPSSSVAKDSQTASELEAIIRSPFKDSDAPIFEVSYLSGGFTTLRLKLPVLLITSLTGTSLSLDHFNMRWEQVLKAGNPKLGKSETLELESLSKPFHQLEVIRRFLVKSGWGECETDDQTVGLRFAGIVHTFSDGNFGTLLEILQNDELISLTVRSTNEEVTEIIFETLVDILGH